MATKTLPKEQFEAIMKVLELDTQLRRAIRELLSARKDTMTFDEWLEDRLQAELWDEIDRLNALWSKVYELTK